MLSKIPPPADKRVAIKISPAAERAVRAGHPWLFAGSIAKVSHEGRPGDLAVVFDRKRRFLAIGLYDPTSPIRVRILQANRPAVIDGVWLAERIGEAAALRAGLPASGTTGYRLVHGENDGLPGLAADLYENTLVLKLYSVAWIPWLPQLLPAFQGQMSFSRLVLRLSRHVGRQNDHLYGLCDGATLAGDHANEPVVFKENGLRFAADVWRGQKTGFFLDQRENRAKIEKLAAGRKLLNLFAYSGGFSLYGARGGARAVLSVDASPPALAAAERNFALNGDVVGVRECRHTTWAVDAFAAMRQLAAEKRRFGLIVVDPPAFAQRNSQIDSALKAYQRLGRLAAPLLTNAGIVAFSSCSSRVSADRFFEAVWRGLGRAGGDFVEIDRSFHPIDHPIGFAEGTYLKTLFLQKTVKVALLRT